MITNRELNRFGPTIFANNNKDVRRIYPMAGRVAELSAYEAVFDARGQQIVTMSAILGSGKTFFLNAARQRFLETRGFREGRNAHQVNATQWQPQRDSVGDLVLQFRDADPAHRCILELEELDRKGEYATLMHALRSALEWLNTSRDGMLVITGDQFLNHPAVADALADAGAGPGGIPVTSIELEPLDRGLLLEAIELRLGLLEEQLPSLSAEDADRAAADILGDILVERTLLPPTSETIANFREALGLLKNTVEFIHRPNPTVNISAADLRRVKIPGRLVLTGGLAQVDEEVRRRVAGMLEHGHVIDPIDTEELRELAGSSATGAELFMKLVQPLVTGQVLEPLGIAYCVDGSPDPETKYVGPFLPRQRTILRVLRTLGDVT